jgi:hypothetical protein
VFGKALVVTSSIATKTMSFGAGLSPRIVKRASIELRSIHHAEPPGEEHDAGRAQPDQQEEEPAEPVIALALHQAVAIPSGASVTILPPWR